MRCRLPAWHRHKSAVSPSRSRHLNQRKRAGEVEYPEFLEIMTTTLARMEERREEGGDASPVPFALLATAYRWVWHAWGLWGGLRTGGCHCMQRLSTSAHHTGPHIYRN